MGARLGRVTKTGTKGFRSLLYRLHYSGLGPRERADQWFLPSIRLLTSNIPARVMLGSTRQ
jgi:hypothetical protein